MIDEILLGFEVDSGDPVHIRPQHLAIFGMTQLSGKTTTLEALISRSGLRGVAFITKRGESGFTKYHRIPPFFKERVDWRYVESLLNTALGEKVKYEPKMRYAIMKVCKEPKRAETLREVRENAVKLRDKAKKDWDKEVYDKLVAYLDIVLPELERQTFAQSVDLQDGVNVMDLSDMKLETQQLIIGSTISYIHEKYQGVVVIIPEAWENIPQSRMTPVKWIVEQYVRKGASIQNYLWIDSQDIGGIDKTPLRQVSTWIMGRMMEAHEVERIIKQLLGVKIPAKDIQTLPLGHFFVTVGTEIKKVYVLPNGIPETFGLQIAKGELDVQRAKEMYKEYFLARKSTTENIDPETIWDILNRLEKTEQNLDNLTKVTDDVLETLKTHIGDPVQHGEHPRLEIKELLERTENLHKKVDALSEIRQVREKMDVPSEIDVERKEVSLTVKSVRQKLQLNQESVAGRIALVYAEGLLPIRKGKKQGWFSTGTLRGIIENRFGIKDTFVNLNRDLTNLVYYGFFERRMRGSRPEYRVKMNPDKAKEQGLLDFEG